MCLQNFSSEMVEKHNKPAIETLESPDLVLTPLVVSRNESEKVLIEGSINSLRISVKTKQPDEVERLLSHKFSRFLVQRAEQFMILRRVQVAVYAQNMFTAPHLF